MTTPDLNFFRMTEAVLDLLNLNTAKLGLAPKLEQLKDELQVRVAGIHLKNQNLVLENEFATVKQEKRVKLERGADELINQIQLYAAMENDSLTKGKINLYYSDLHLVGGDKLIDTCTAIYTLATTLGAKLTDYKVVPATLTGFKQLIVDFSALLSAPRMDITSRAAVNKELKKDISELRLLLTEKIDKSMNTLKNTETEFYTAYTNARVIIDRLGKRNKTTATGDTTGMISGTLTDTETGEALTDVIVQLEGHDEATTTDEDGTFVYDYVEPGVYTLTCIKELYKTLTLANIEVKAGEETETEGSMEKQ